MPSFDRLHTASHNDCIHAHFDDIDEFSNGVVRLAGEHDRLLSPVRDNVTLRRPTISAHPPSPYLLPWTFARKEEGALVAASQGRRWTDPLKGCRYITT
ncbi:hypothetical protein BJ912DRAFT_1060596 [Pholiota molesta]|nr:hypothetical protein BJ912DRAFT_1060596 [Pholiota molesta]